MYGVVSGRRWQAREERIADLRSVLDQAGEHLKTALQSFGDTHANVKRMLATTKTELPSKTLVESVERGFDALRELWAIGNRVQIRRGAERSSPHGVGAGPDGAAARVLRRTRRREPTAAGVTPVSGAAVPSAAGAPSGSDVSGVEVTSYLASEPPAAVE